MKTVNKVGAVVVMGNVNARHCKVLVDGFSDCADSSHLMNFRDMTWVSFQVRNTAMFQV